MNRPQTIAITGGSGFMGRHLARRLRAEGRNVRVIDLAPLPDDLVRAGVEIVQASVLDAAALDRAFAGCDAVVHLAARVSDFGPRAVFDLLNVGATKAALAAARRAGARRFVQMSSCAVLDYGVGYDGATEEAPAGGHPFHYGQTKWLAEQAVTAAHAPDFQTVIVRPGLVPYGPEDLNTTEQMMNAVVRGMPLLVDGGESLISLSYAANLVDGLVLCLDRPEAAGELFYIADDERLTWRQFVLGLSAALGERPNLGSSPRWLAMAAATVAEKVWMLLRRDRGPSITRYRIWTATSNLHFSSAKAKRLLGYAPQVGFDEGLRRSVEWYRSRSRSVEAIQRPHQTHK